MKAKQYLKPLGKRQVKERKGSQQNRKLQRNAMVKSSFSAVLLDPLFCPQNATQILFQFKGSEVTVVV